MVSHIRLLRAAGLLTAVCVAAIGCGNGEAPRAPATGAVASGAAALTAADRTHMARAAVYTAEVARHQQIAAQERAMAATYAQWAPEAGSRVKTNFNQRQREQAEALAAGVDRLAAETQKAATYHATEASRELAR